MVTSFSRTRRVVFDLVGLESSEERRQRQFLGLRSEDLVGIKSSERQVLPLASYQRPEMIKDNLIISTGLFLFPALNLLFYDHHDYYDYCT